MDPKGTGKFIAKLRKEKNLTQIQLAEKLQVTNKAVSKWETGNGYPDIDSLLALSKVFDVSVNELLSGKRLRSPRAERDAQKAVAAEFLQTEKKRRHSKWTIIGLTLLIVVSIVLKGFSMLVDFRRLQEHYAPDTGCVIAEDYASMTIYGTKYVKVFEDCYGMVEWDEALFDRPMVGDKSSDEEAVYSIKYCDDYDIVCLIDPKWEMEKGLYCREDKVKEYTEKFNDTKPAVYCLLINGYPKVWADVSADVQEYLETFNRNKLGTCPDEDFEKATEIGMRAKDSPFIQPVGDISKYSGKYYFGRWYDDWGTTKYVRLPKRLYEELDSLFKRIKD